MMVVPTYPALRCAKDGAPGTRPEAGYANTRLKLA